MAPDETITDPTAAPAAVTPTPETLLVAFNEMERIVKDALDREAALQKTTSDILMRVNEAETQLVAIQQAAAAAQATAPSPTVDPNPAAAQPIEVTVDPVVTEPAAPVVTDPVPAEPTSSPVVEDTDPDMSNCFTIFNDLDIVLTNIALLPEKLQRFYELDLLAVQVRKSNGIFANYNAVIAAAKAKA